MDIHEQFAAMWELLSYRGEPLPACCRPTIVQLLPGGRMFDQLNLASSMDVDRALRRTRDALAGCIKEPADYDRLTSAITIVREYIEECEVYVLRSIDFTSSVHQAFLLLLRELYPPLGPRRPTVFLIAGPSASGKDHVTHAVFDALRARGYLCQFVLKYIQRESRPEERRIAPFLRYQIVLSKEEFTQLQFMGEIIYPYEKYGSQYGFSKSNLDRLLTTNNADVNVCIMSAFEQVDGFVSYLRSLGFKVVPVLIHASLETCRKRLLNRLLIIRNDPNYDENKAVAELWLRAEEVAKDIKRIVEREAVIETHYTDRITNDHDGDNRPIQELYRFIVSELRSDDPT